MWFEILSKNLRCARLIDRGLVICSKIYIFQSSFLTERIFKHLCLFADIFAEIKSVY